MLIAMAVAHRVVVLFILSSAAIYTAVLAQINPCSNYSHIRDAIRSSAYVVKQPNYEHLICDKNLAPGWYRFNSGLDGDMPTTCPDILHCGTHVPIWLHGSLPTIGQGAVTRDVCGHTPSGCCDYKDTIQVQHCGSYFVYFLKPTRGCSVAYCAGSRTPCPPNKWSASGYGPRCRDQYPIMTLNPTLSNPIVQRNTFVFRCHINFNSSRTDIGFAVTWLFDGKLDPKLNASYITGARRDSYIDQQDLVGHLGESISCRAQVYFLNTPNMPGPGIVSNNYWMGLKLLPARLVVGTKDPPQEVKLISTIPMVCNSSATPICRLNLLLEPNNHTSLTTTGRTNCNVTLTPQDWDPSKNQAVLKFDVLAQRGILNKDKHLVLHFQRTSTWDAPKIFNHYQVPSMPILYKDSPTAMCSCIGDPHCITLDTMPSNTSVSSMNSHLWNNGYDFHKIGEFLMYNSTNKNREFEVQIRIWSCSNAGGTCICAVMAREGNDVIRIDMCHQAYGKTFPLVTFPNKGNISQGSMVQQDKAGKTWVISFPSGAVVTVINHAGKDMKVFIHAPEDDRGFTEGLCGTFDGNYRNDLTGKNGQVHQNVGTFAETWRIPIGSSMFDKPPKQDPKLNNDIYFCNCNQAKHLTTCGNDLKHTKPPIPAICPSCKPLKQNQKPVQSGRKKRQIGISSTDDDINYYFDYGLSWNPPTQAGFPTPSGLTLAGATKLCTDALQRSSAVRQCTSRAGLTFLNEIKMCVEDIKLTDDRDFAQSYVETAIMTCQEFILRDPSFYNSVTGDPPAFITTDLCPSDCSGHGTCIHGTCYCDYGYVDEACSIDSRKPPTLYNIVGSSMQHQEAENCDIRRRPCQKIYVVGDNIRDKGTMMKCHIEEYQLSSGKFVPTGRSFETSLEYESMYNVRCIMPTKNQVQGKDVVGYNISISNDGQHYSNEIQAFIIDSDCMSCSEKGGTCTMKPNTCLIDGQCRTANEHKPGDTNQLCRPGVSKDQWTSTQPIPTATPQTHHSATPQHAISTTQFPTPSSEVLNNRSDIWTFSRTGCTCNSDTSKNDCACCDVDGCQCPGSNRQQCVQCGHMENCGHPLPVFFNGLDGYTLFTSDCQCYFNMTRSDCACCQNNGCQCDEPHENQCVRCGSTGQCGAKQWLFGPSSLIGKK